MSRLTSITRDGDESDDALSDLTDSLPENEDPDDDAETSLFETLRAYFE
ncbi:hypothetical protein ACWGDS_02640 [Streptomyces sp. NPDC055059]|jgi:hypothetical protein|uniref:Uncharacterized protein n=1 Tax=Streptomyces sp. NBC_00119 TaxID=2975659 RepID=A0AAU1UGT7_9ACTN|nr:MULTISPECIES: hypothetical protein [unclassified Streptomyces]MCX4647341.1 hypothetical protein [Streptomyces sp. NBC_01446]MCX5319873.1 hypothetical protein [Streptomyces sp. NBC_00120]